MKKNYISKALFCAFSTSCFTALPSFADDSFNAEGSLQEVVITASKVETPLREVGVSISVISHEELELRGYQTVADALRSQPGVSVSNSGGQGKATAIRIRGEEAYRTLIVVDGIDVSDPTGTQSGPQSQHLMSSNDIEQIEILRGPQGLMYGADAGGVINIRTRSGAQDFNGEVSMEVGRYDTRSVNAYVAGGNDVVDAFVSVSDSETDGFDLSEPSAGAANENDGYENTTVHTKFGWTLSEQIKAKLVIRDTESFNEFDGCGWGAGASNDCTGVFDQAVARLSLAYVGQSIQHNVGLQSVKTERDNFNQGVSSFSTEGKSEKLDYLGNWSMTDMVALGWGLDLEQEEVVADGGDLYKRDQVGVFGELRANVDNTFYATAGLRLDDNEDFGQHASVRVSGAYVQTLSNTLNLKYRTSYGTGFRAPSLSEIAYNAKNVPSLPELTEELSSGYDVGVELYQSNGFNAQITYFNQMIEDEIGFDLVTWAGYEQKIGVAHSKGVELSIEAPVVSGVTAFGNYTYNDTLTKEDTQRIRRPRNVASIGLKFSSQDKRLNVLLSSRYARGVIDQFYDEAIFDTVTVGLGDYNVVDISANYTLKNGATIFTRVENALDEKYQEVTNYSAAEPAFYLGIKTSL